MARWLTVHNPARTPSLVVRARWCVDFACRLRGLTWRRSLDPGTGLLLVQSGESRSNAAIHMWVVFFPLGVVWLDSQRRVVDVCRALPWRIYVPRSAARYVLEGEPTILERVAVGEVLEFVDDAYP